MKRIAWVALGAAAALGLYMYIRKTAKEKVLDNDIDKLIAWYEKKNIHNDDLANETKPIIVT